MYRLWCCIPNTVSLSLETLALITAYYPNQYIVASDFWHSNFLITREISSIFFCVACSSINSYLNLFCFCFVYYTYIAGTYAASLFRINVHLCFSFLPYMKETVYKERLEFPPWIYQIHKREDEVVLNFSRRTLWLNGHQAGESILINVAKFKSYPVVANNYKE